MPGIEPVVAKYETTVEALKKRMGSDANSTNQRIAEARKRLEPLAFSLDAAWKLRLRSFTDKVVNDPTIGSAEGPNKLLLKALDSLDKTQLDRRLKDWLLEADPFKERHDPNAVGDRGAKLLEAIESCFEITASRADTQELQPELVAMADRVRRRMSDLTDGRRPDSAAVSVTHQMYLELQNAMGRSANFVRERLQKEAGYDDPDDMIGEWDQGLAEKSAQLSKTYAKHPFMLWFMACYDTLPKSNTSSNGREYIFTEFFKTRDFESEINNLYKTISADIVDEKDYVMRVREAAWPVQSTIDYYLRGIDAKWGNGQRDLRDSLNQALCALNDRVLKEVNFLIAARLARQG